MVCFLRNITVGAVFIDRLREFAVRGNGCIGGIQVIELFRHLLLLHFGWVGLLRCTDDLWVTYSYAVTHFPNGGNTVLIFYARRNVKSIRWRLFFHQGKMNDYGNIYYQIINYNENTHLVLTRTFIRNTMHKSYEMTFSELTN